MALSSDLISQFVKITKDDEKSKADTTVYGTAVVNDGITYVRLDGSESPTPVTTTSHVKDNERVTVIIKDHKATITGNLSSPSARKSDVDEVSNKISEFEIINADFVTTKELETERARINTLVSENVEIRGTLSANKADISALESDNLTINNKLKANEADIEKLKTNKLDASIAEITYATIKSLDAESGKIDILDTNIADINTLIFGSASGTTIQTSFANAVIAQLGSAQIKSAMIESIAADLIKSGDIITNNVRVMSEDGKLLISDETIQISDSSRVRVQIGKDANGDYSINIWDVNGSLMFSEGGITDNAIKDAIIRNDMISDNADISAHKLDIDSLFEEINGSKKTIKSSKIHLNEESQTLDVAFESITTNIEEIQNGMTSQGTEITAIQGQIDSKVWQQDINNAVGEVNNKTETLSTRYSELKQEIDNVEVTVASHTSAVTDINNKVTSLEIDVDGFKTNVSNTYATKEAVSEVEQTATDLTVRFNDLEIGGRNLWEDGEFLKGIEQGNINLWGFTEVVNLDAGNPTGHDKALHMFNGNGRVVCQRFATASEELVGKTLTMQCWIKYENVEIGSNSWNTINVGKWNLTYTLEDGTTTTTDYSSILASNLTGTSDGWVQMIAKRSLRSDVKAVTLGPIQIGLEDAAAGDAWVTGIKLEYGDKATDWTPAPEDLQNGIDEASKVATNYMNFSNSGLVVGDMTASSLGKNVRIDSDSIDIRNGETVLASFGANELILGQNASDSVINLCDGAAKMSAITSGATTSYPHYDGIKIESEEIELDSSEFQTIATNGTSFINTGKIRLTTQSSAAGSVSSFNSECKIASSGSRLSTGLLSSAYSSASSTCTDIYASHYNASSGTTNSNYISVYPTHTQVTKPIVINNVYVTAINKHLWSGANYMNASQSITLSEAVSAQVNGIVLVWSYYESGTAKDFNFHFHFVPKWFVSNYAAKGSDYALANHTGNVLGHKYLYISDTKITGNDYNDDGNLVGSKATYTNTAFVLRAVIGV